MLILEKIRSFFSENVLASEVQTTKGLLFWPNNDPSVGPKYLVRLHFPLEPTSVDWSEMEKYIDGGNLAVCKKFFSECNGFSIGTSANFSAFGILVQDGYDGVGLSYLNVPFDLRGQSYRSYPEFAPERGYFLSHFNFGSEQAHHCDVISESGEIISGNFRQNEDILERFDSFDQWLDVRVPQALMELCSQGA